MLYVNRPLLRLHFHFSGGIKNNIRTYAQFMQGAINSKNSQFFLDIMKKGKERKQGGASANINLPLRSSVPCSNRTNTPN